MSDKIGMAVGSALYVLGHAIAAFAIQDLPTMITGVATSIAGAVLILAPAYAKFRSIRREQDLEDSKQVAASLEGTLRVRDDEIARLKARVAELAEDVQQWRDLYRASSHTSPKNNETT